MSHFARGREGKQTKKELLKKRGGEKQKKTLKTGDSPVLSINDKTEKHNTQKAISEDLGWSTGKVAQTKKVCHLMTKLLGVQKRD